MSSFRVKFNPEADPKKVAQVHATLRKMGFTNVGLDFHSFELWEPPAVRKAAPLPGWVGLRTDVVRDTSFGGNVKIVRRPCNWLGWPETCNLWLRDANRRNK